MAANNPDYIIIGAGSAGSVLANRLSRDNTVTLIEAGPIDHRWDFRLHMPAALSHVLSSDRYNWFYHSEPEPGLNDRQIYCPRGRVLGGSSSINGMIYIRGHQQDFDDWAAHPGLENWRFQDCLPYFKKAESFRAGEPQHRGQDGPLHISRGTLSNPLFNAWLAAGSEAGFSRTSDFNGEQQEGFGEFDRTIKAGRRFSAARAYLHPIIHRANLTLVTKTQVSKIIFEGSVAVGVEYLAKGKLATIRANREVILCGGAINSPQLLMLSGIGNAKDLTKLGININFDLPGVGQNLQDHLEAYVQFSCQKPVSIYPALKWYNQLKIGLEWTVLNTGPGATNHFEAGAFLKSDSSKSYPDLQFHFLPVATNYDGKETYEGHGFQVHVGPMRPTSRGSIKLRSCYPTAPPLICFNYNTTPEDQQVMQRGIELVREVVGQSSFNEFRGHEIRPGATATDLNQFVRRHAESAYHPSCSCKMGSDPLAVVDQHGRVHGVHGLRVVDASIMPDITNGNLNAPVIMMAEKLADAILGCDPATTL